MNLSQPASYLPKSQSITRIQITGRSSHSSCGYCTNKEKRTSNINNEKVNQPNSISYGCLSEVMSVEDYQSMMLLGWRRSGNYFYKPCMYETCCPQYTIRLNAKDFKATKSQKKVVKNISKYLAEEKTHPILETTTMQQQDQRTSSSVASLSTSININSDNNILATATNKLSDSKGKHINEDISYNEKLSIHLEKSSFTDEKFELYKKYQIDIHKDDPNSITPKGFKRFLVDSPLIDTTTTTTITKSIATPPTTTTTNQQQGSTSLSTTQVQFGTFHQLYRLNDVLIAVGVLDILPTGVSSVYVFYDNNYRHLVLGKYTALQEINFCVVHNLPYYYMGFYIHTCEKMKYKAEYGPSELLCPTTLAWFPLVDCLPLLDHYKFSPFNPQLAALLRSILDDDKNSSNNSKNEHKFLDLSQFAPQFNQLKDITLVPLDLKSSSSSLLATELLYISDLTQQGFEILQPILSEWLDHVGPQLGQKLVISLR